MQKAKDILQPFTTDLICHADDLLTTLIHKLSDPDQAMVAYDQEQKYIGLIAPEFLLNANRHYPRTKVKQVVQMPPTIDADTQIDEIAKHMYDSQIYTLPVTKNQEIIGIVRIDDLRKSIQSDHDIVQVITQNLRPQEPLTVKENQSIRDILAALTNHPSTLIVITDDQNRPRGVIHTGHFIDILFVDDNKQRFGKNGNRWTDWSFDTEPHELADVRLLHIINPYYAPTVEFMDTQSIAQELLRQKVYCVLTTDKDQLTGIVTMRDLAGSIAGVQPEAEVPITIKRPSDSVSDTEFLNVQAELRKFANKMHARTPLQRIDVASEEPKYTTKQTAVFNTSVTLIPFAKGHYYAQANEKNFSLSVRSALCQIEKQYQRDHSQSTTYDNASMSEVTGAENLAMP